MPNLISLRGALLALRAYILTQFHKFRTRKYLDLKACPFYDEDLAAHVHWVEKDGGVGCRHKLQGRSSRYNDLHIGSSGQRPTDLEWTRMMSELNTVSDNETCVHIRGEQ